LEFGDVVMTLASLIVILTLVIVPVDIVLVSAIGLELGIWVSRAVSTLIAGLIGGYIFAGKLAKERLASSGKIVVLGVFLVILVVLNLAGQPDWIAATKDTYEAANPGTTLSTAEWVSVVNMAAFQLIFMNMIMMLVIGFIGLYVGSMLRKPSKS